MENQVAAKVAGDRKSAVLATARLVYGKYMYYWFTSSNFCKVKMGKAILIVGE
jgi:hypothetical protein